ncbi:hypothetical protein MN116_004144 [Schistosoma mekongi]|uniref:Uncharacterized protein n=1 Tax=Schistosoma mekongi TaxID=38744 RepID=A0AAE1ZEV1_SCHME|nr:hypothetical protein MN116_004144 [Schistosoma mekongi]
MHCLTIFCFIFLIYAMNLITGSDTVELTDPLEEDYDATIYTNHDYLKKQYPLITKRYLTMTAEKYLWNKFLNEIKTGNLHKFMPPRIPTALRFG